MTSAYCILGNIILQVLKSQVEYSMGCWSLWIYIYNIKLKLLHVYLLNCWCYQLPIFNASYHIISHHFYMRKYDLVSCTGGVLMLRGSIPHEVQSHLIFRKECLNCFKFGVYVEGSCRCWFVLFVNLSVMEIPLCEVNVVLRHSIWQSTSYSMYDEIIGVNRTGNVDKLCTSVSL